MTLLLDQAGETLVHIPSTPKHVLCPACGGVKKQVKQRSGMPQPTVAPNPYKVDPSAQALIDRGKDQVKIAKIKARRQEFAERVAKWDAARIREEMDKIDEAVKAHEDKIAECLRQRMILEDQLAQLQSPVVRPGVQVVPALNPSHPKSDPCPF